MWLLSPPKQSRGSQCAREARLGPTVRGVTRDRSPLGLSLAGSGGERRWQRQLGRSCCAASLCVCMHVHMRVCVHGCAPASVHRGGTSPLRGGDCAAHPWGSASSVKLGSLPLAAAPCGSSPWLFSPLLGLSVGLVGGRLGCQAHFSIGDPLHVPLLPPSSHGCWCVFPSPSHTSLGSRYTLLAHFVPPPLPHSLPPISQH